MAEKAPFPVAMSKYHEKLARGVEALWKHARARTLFGKLVSQVLTLTVHINQGAGEFVKDGAPPFIPPDAHLDC
jgi:hypothetical protein